MVPKALGEIQLSFRVLRSDPNTDFSQGLKESASEGRCVGVAEG